MKTQTGLLAVLMFGFLVLPPSLAAQLRIIPQVGLYAPVTDLGTVTRCG
jgi:hypothetical protein